MQNALPITSSQYGKSWLNELSNVRKCDSYNKSKNEGKAATIVLKSLRYFRIEYFDHMRTHKNTIINDVHKITVYIRRMELKSAEY